MNGVAALLVPLALLVPALAAERPDRALEISGAGERENVAAEPSRPGENAAAGVIAPLRVLEAARRTPLENQVRIEQRVIIRIAPSSERMVQQSMARLARRADQFEERRAGDCVPIGAIAAVYPSNENRLLLLMRDRRVMSASLERACKAADFYAGFYVERSEDGQICSRRDRLQSRAGASCRISRLGRLVASGD